MAIQAEKGGDDAKAMQAKKVYYLACGFCRWSSRDVGIEDKSVGEFKLPSVEQIMASCMYSNHFFFFGGGGRREEGGVICSLFQTHFSQSLLNTLNPKSN